MNLAIRGIDAQIAHGDTFHNDRHPDLKADYVLANLIKPLFARASKAADETQVLAGLRDTLLPKLVSGELRVTEMEHVRIEVRQCLPKL
jgi:hypothetical protein